MKRDTLPLVILLISLLIMILLVCFGAVQAVDHNELTYLQQKDAAHEIAEQARSLGLPENDPIIVRAKEVWQQAHNEQITIATMLSQVIYNESRGIQSDTHKACVAWVPLNRADAGYGTIMEVLTAPAQFAYSPGTPVQQDLYDIAWDVLIRWQQEKAGEEDVGRVLPADYLWYHGDGRYNYFRNAYASRTYWDFSLESPYTT